MFKLFGCPSQARLCRNSQHSFLILSFFSCSFLFSKPFPPFLLSSTTDISFKLLHPAFSEISTFLENFHNSYSRHSLLFTILTVGIVFRATLNLLFFFVLFMNCFINILFCLSSLEPYYISMYHKI